VRKSRLTRAQCQAIAEETLTSLATITPAEALRRFGVGSAHVEVMTDESTGKPYHQIITALGTPENGVHLSVSVSAEPQVVRPARRLKLIAQFIDGWRTARSAGVSHTMIGPDPLT
jgi:hypothetical protein